MHSFRHRHEEALWHQDNWWWWDAIQLALGIIFVFMSLMPGQALAFENGVATLQLPLIFVRDPGLVNVAVVGIEAFPKERTVAGLLNSPSLMVRSSLTEGSVVRVLTTAYSSTVDQTDASPFITASGQRVGLGVAAANFLPFGTKIRMGRNIYTVLDRLNARYNDKYIVDIWLPSRMEAIAYGARIVEMEIVALP